MDLQVFKVQRKGIQGGRRAVVESKNSSGTKLKVLEARVKELEGAVGRKQMSIDYLEEMIELAEAELGIEIKKNAVPDACLVRRSTRKGV